MKMIYAKCPNCGKEHTITADDLEELIKNEKTTIRCSCRTAYTVKRGLGNFLMREADQT